MPRRSPPRLGPSTPRPRPRPIGHQIFAYFLVVRKNRGGWYVSIWIKLLLVSSSLQIVVLELGKLMAACHPSKVIQVMGCSFSLNPGPFNVKEHVLITIFEIHPMASMPLT
jgi:hypothetical protein